MKKQFFSIVMMIALVIVAGTAMAQTGVKPYPGGTYTYSLSGIALQNNGTVAIAYSGADAIIITPKTGLGLTASPFTIAQATTSLSFDVTYPLNSTTGIKTFTVTITDGATTCSNFIKLAVEIQALPTLSLSILASEAAPICQLKEANPLDNQASALTDGVIGNTFTYTVTPVVTNVAASGLFDYEYNITLPTNSVLKGFNVANGKISGTKVTYTGVTAVATDVFTVTFKTTTGKADQLLTATIVDSKLTVTSGGGQYVGTITNSLLGTDDVTVKSMPSIGSFTWNP